MLALIALSPAQRRDYAGGLTIDYPLPGSIFPPDMAAPTFLWDDRTPAEVWRVRLDFGDGSAPLEFETAGPRLAPAAIDPRAVGPTNELPQAATQHSWKPDANI